jgi:hypothetical protein
MGVPNGAGVPNQGPKSGSQIGVPNRGPKSGSQIPNWGPKSGVDFYVYSLPNIVVCYINSTKPNSNMGTSVILLPASCDAGKNHVLKKIGKGRSGYLFLI